MKPLVICNTAIRQDAEGRYCLNDLHRAAMARGRATKAHRPGSFMRRAETDRLIGAAKKRCTDSCIDPAVVIKGGDKAQQGTFVSRPLVYAYAMWIDADFHLDVIEAFDTMQTASLGAWQQMQALIAQEVESKVRASFGSYLMHQRKREIPYFTAEIARLEAEVQPSLPLH
ncbi:KilA-N domain-containing protein [Azotobacter salinestris]|uniref:KilA-N domain-containing protein n=1 Tax=Azotobacter salinestris TaxID=69964 RepID=UPI0032DE6A3F